MPISRLRLCRSLLFVPGSNPRAVEKARGLDADMVILDLEDAVRPEDKDEARARAVAALNNGFDGSIKAVRVNVPGSQPYGRDMIALRESSADFIIVPKVEHPSQASGSFNLTRKPVLAMIETAAGILSAPAIAHSAVGLIAGTNDLSANLALPADAGRAGLICALQAIVLAARAAGASAFDGVYNRLEEEEGLRRECEEGRAFGFDGKTLIHPGQIAVTNRIFSPSPDEIGAAERLIAAATGGAERFEGRMIESMHVDQAHAVLAKARR